MWNIPSIKEDWNVLSPFLSLGWQVAYGTWGQNKLIRLSPVIYWLCGRNSEELDNDPVENLKQMQ